MRRTWMLLCYTILFIFTLQAQEKKQNKKYVDDEACGCELVFIDGIQTTHRNGLFGFKREDGTELVPPKYKFVDEFHDGFCLVLDDYEKVGLINKQGKEILPCVFQEIVYPTEGIIKVRKGDFFGYYDTTGREMITPQWLSASSFFEGRAVVSVLRDSLTFVYGFIDTTGRMVLPAVYEYAFPFKEGRAVVKRYDRMGLIDTNGKEVLPIKYAYLSGMYMGRIFARDEESGLIAMFDGKGRQITSFVYNDVISYGEGYYVVQRDSVQTYLDMKGRERFGKYQNASSFMDGYASVQRGDRCGIINKRGKFVLPLEYENQKMLPDAYRFHDGLALVEKDGKVGFINKKGKVVVPIQYKSAFRFSDGLAPVSTNMG